MTTTPLTYPHDVKDDLDAAARHAAPAPARVCGNDPVIDRCFYVQFVSDTPNAPMPVLESGEEFDQMAEVSSYEDTANSVAEMVSRHFLGYPVKVVMETWTGSDFDTNAAEKCFHEVISYWLDGEEMEVTNG